MRAVAFAAIFAACVGVSGAASAADLSLKDTPEVEYAPVLGWTGFYIGAHGGGAWGDVEVGDTYTYIADPYAENTIDTSGLLGGIQVGYNWQRGNVVFGFEADLGYMGIDDSVSADLPRSISDDPRTDLNGTYSISGGLYGDLTGRIGYATEKSLFYVKGGAAFLKADFNSHYVGQNCSTVNGTRACHGIPDKTSVFDFENSEMLWGWTIGVGMEYALTNSLSLKLEYQHFDFGSMDFSYDKTVNFGPGNYKSRLYGDTEADVTVDAVKVGVNYRFNGAPDALK